MDKNGYFEQFTEEEQQRVLDFAEKCDDLNYFVFKHHFEYDAPPLDYYFPQYRRILQREFPDLIDEVDTRYAESI